MDRNVFVRGVKCVALAFSLGTASFVCGAEWAGFRGPVPAELMDEALPLSWSPQEHVRWSASLTGVGQSSPVIWGDQVYVTTVEGPKKEQCHVSAFHLKNGEALWRATVKNATPEEATNLISKAAPTAVADAAGIIALFEGGNVIALSHSGEKRWERNLVDEYGAIPSRHGLGSSLIQTDDNVVVWIEREEDPYLLCLKKQTGDVVWKVPGLGATSWSSPVLLPVAGTTHLVFSATGKLRGLDPATGKELWTMEGISGNATPSPCVVGDGLLLLGATDGRGEAGGGKPAQSNCLVRIHSDSDSGEHAEFVWRAKRATCSFGSPIVHQGLAYFVNRAGILYCLDAETGEEVYAERTPESCWATPLAVGSRIYLVGQKGTTTVIKAGREFEILSTNHLWDKEDPADAPAGESSGRRAAGGPGGFARDSEIQYAVAAVPGSLLIRTGDRLFCLGD